MPPTPAQGRGSGSGFPLLLLGRITGLWGIRSNPSRGFPVSPEPRYIGHDPFDKQHGIGVQRRYRRERTALNAYNLATIS